MTQNTAKIVRYAGLAGVRKRSNVYIGPNNSEGLWTICREPLDNGIDLALRDKPVNKLVHFVIDSEPNSYWVLDEGPGFPVHTQVFQDEQGRKEKLSVFYAATGLTHTGSNLDSDEISRGVNGIGIKATNAMSKLFEVWTFSGGKWYYIQYKDAKLVKPPVVAKPPKLPHGIKARKGSIIHFHPDLSLFTKGTKLNLQDTVDWCKLTSHLVPNIEIRLTSGKGTTKSFKSKGIAAYLEEQLAALNATAMGKPFVLHGRNVDVALSFANAETPSVKAYTNGLLNVDGGEHVKAIFDALTTSLKPHRRKTDTFKPSDLQDGVVGLVNAKLSAPRFNTQRKDQLIDDRAYKPCYDAALKAFVEFWNKNKLLARNIITRANELRQRTASFLADKQLIKKVKGASRRVASKLAGINSSRTPVEERELFLVEGDSAGGTAKKARNKACQATFPMRGKPLNVMDATKEKINANAEVTNILAAIGMGSQKDPEAINYGKIIFLADPDIDGQHINCLLMTLFWKFAPHLFKQGKIYMLKAPEYYTEHNKKIYSADTPQEVYKLAGSSKVEIRHIKGWGELDAYKMKPMAFNPDTRQLIRINPPKTRDGVAEFEQLMGKNPTFRQKLLGVSE